MISLTSPVRTRAHGWPAWVKLAALCLVTAALFMVDNLWVLAGAAAGMCALYALPGRVFLWAGLKALWRLWPFILIFFVWAVFQGRLYDGAVITLRMITTVGLANLVTMTTILTDMMALLAKLTAPLARIGIRPRPIELALALAIRFIPEITRKGSLVAQSWRARSPRRVGWRIVLPLALLALDDADHVAEALRARGGV